MGFSVANMPSLDGCGIPSQKPFKCIILGIFGFGNYSFLTPFKGNEHNLNLQNTLFKPLNGNVLLGKTQYIEGKYLNKELNMLMNKKRFHMKYLEVTNVSNKHYSTIMK